MNIQEINTWILEVTFQENCLVMSLYEKEQPSPIKTVSSLSIDLSKIEHLKNDIIEIINRTNSQRLLDKDLIDELKKGAGLLYDLLLTRQVKRQLSSLGQVNLILSIDEKLISIPWEFLYDGKNFICLKFNIGRSIRTQNSHVQIQYRNIPSRLRMLILANPTGDLKSAYHEGLYIKNRLTRKGKIIVDFKAQDISSNYVCKNLRDYDIIHFAGHCEYDIKNPQESGWVLSNGWVSAKDILALGQRGDLPIIVFVNACQSARTNDNLLDSQTQRNVYGLAQAFLFAGVRHYLGSFWMIEDKLSSEFAEEFYNQVANAQPIGKAVRLARLRLFCHYGISAIAWAGYVFYGEPGFIFPSPATSPAGRAVGRRRIQLPGINKKRAVGIAVGLAILILISVLMKILPAINPNTYFMFSQAKRFYIQGDNNRVLKALDEIIRDESLYLPVWELRGDVHFRLGKFTSALSDYFDYARFSERKRDYRHLATAYIKIAWVYHMSGDYQKSEEFYQKALDLSRKHKDKLNEADAMARLAVWHIDKGDNEAAFSLLMKSSEINRQRIRHAKHKFNLACDYFNIAYLYTEKEDYSAAREFYAKSQGIFEELGQTPEFSDYYFNMGEIALFEKRYDSALQYYQKGLALDKQLNHRFNLSSDYWMLGELYWEIGKFAEAEDYFKEAIFMCRQIDNRPVLAGVYYDFGLMYKQMGRTHKAKEYLYQALKFYKEIDTPDYQEVKQAYGSLE